jgi:imidazolonepropionase-like amidohydrolase
MTMQDSIEHLSGYPVQQASLHRELAVASREAGVWNCPTLAVFTQRVTVNMPPAEREQLLDARRSFVTALYENGARILAGTDGGWLLPAGVALHDELDELVAAGLSRFDALSAATRSGGEYLGQPIGTIATGNRADLLLVASNPLEDLRVLRRPDAVMLHGEWVYAQGRRRAVRH